ncbi:MAG: MucR family transcriptional regulator [Mesorhizobium sp.]|uniref:MucR family transcriptional regulator n=1 Tax=Mesorhizobium sp. TaxID=1871066 RepID=UPI001AD48DB7|nr:MucR family transcriptional regulator [Mesorhizobium sp.]MBN9220235.1 MucR family transcriptional regulator [Mesorhizobium sp.]
MADTGAPKSSGQLDPIISVTADIVSSYVSNNPVPAAELPEFIGRIHASIKAISDGATNGGPDEIRFAVPVKKSVMPDFIICLEDGRRFKSLKRHIETNYGLTPDQYRKKWNLPPSYPMVAPNYSATRSRLAKSMGLGRKGK